MRRLSPMTILFSLLTAVLVFTGLPALNLHVAPAAFAQGAASRMMGVSPAGRDTPFHVTQYGWPGCDQHVAISGNTAATTQSVAGVSGQRVHLCGYLFDAAGATTVQLVRGTGSSCTSSTAITGVMSLITGTPVAYAAGGDGSVAVTAAGESLCWINSGAVQVSGTLNYTVY